MSLVFDSELNFSLGLVSPSYENLLFSPGLNGRAYTWSSGWPSLSFISGTALEYNIQTLKARTAVPWPHFPPFFPIPRVPSPIQAPFPLPEMEDLPLSALRRRFVAVGLGLGSLSVRQDEATTIPEVEVLGVAFLGPHALATFISAIEMGIIIACFARFLARSEEKTRIKVLVYFLTFVAMCVEFTYSDIKTFLIRSYLMDITTHHTIYRCILGIEWAGFRRGLPSRRGGRSRCGIMAIGWVQPFLRYLT